MNHEKNLEVFLGNRHSIAFFPVIGLIAQFAGNLPLAACAYSHSPGFIIGTTEFERIAFEADSQTELLANCNKINAGPLKLRLNCEQDSSRWENSAKASISELTRLLPGNPPLPVIETRALFDSHGRMDNPFTLAVNHESDEPLRTMAHELTHLYLLWALLPGLPIDCPRWMNEGLAELVSGNLAGDKRGWSKFALISQRDLVTLSVVSPAFSWSGWQVEWHGREAVSVLLERHGETIFRRLIYGLRFARPFHSVYLIVSGQTPESFESSWLKHMKTNRVLENQSPKDVFSRCLWIAENKRIIELESLLNGTSSEFINKEQKKWLTGVAKIREARRQYEAGEFNAAIGWLRGVSRQTPGVSTLFNQIAESIRKDSGPQNSFQKTKSLTKRERYPWFRNMSPILAWLIAFLFGMLVVAVYSIARKKLVPGFIKLWNRHGQVSLVFRWLIVGLTGLVGSWFLKFLIISMIPYSGLAAISDLNRILLAEFSNVILWSGLAWQLKRWDSQILMNQVPSTKKLNLKFSKAIFFYLFISSLPPIIAVWQGGWQRTNIPFFQILMSIFLFLVSSWAFSAAIWGAAMRWNDQFSQKNHICPAIIYALFRGGLLVDLWGSLFVLVAGYKISQFTFASKTLSKPILADVLFLFPALLLSASWFPAIDPLAGIWYGGDRSIIWWIIPTVALLVIPSTTIRSKNSGNSSQTNISS